MYSISSGEDLVVQPIDYVNGPSKSCAEDKSCITMQFTMEMPSMGPLAVEKKETANLVSFSSTYGV